MKWFTVAMDEAELRDLYERQRLTTREIAEKLGASPAMIQKRLHQFGIPIILGRRREGLSKPKPRPEKPPDPETLRDLYLRWQLTAYEIAAMYGLTGTTIYERLRKHGIPIRPKGPAAPTREIIPPSPEQLDRLIHVDHLSYAEVGRRHGVSESVVSKWIGLHGIRRPTIREARLKGKALPVLDPETLRAAYESGMSARAIGLRYGTSDSMILKWCKQHGIERRPAGWRQERYFGTDGHEVESTYEIRICDWLSSRDIPHDCGPRLPGSNYRADFLANGWYIEVWGVEKNAAYEARRAKKEAFYRKSGLPLIGVELSRIYNRYGRLDKLLRPCANLPGYNNPHPLFRDATEAK